MKNLILILITLLPLDAISESEVITLQNEKFQKLHGVLDSHNDRGKDVILLVHGTRGHQKMEIIDSIKSILSENQIDSLSINLSYGEELRENSFFSCDKSHRHLESSSIDELLKWYKYLRTQKYSNVYLLGHSRGGLNVLQLSEIISHNDIGHVKGLFLLAPVSDTLDDYILEYETKGVDLKSKINEMIDRVKTNNNKLNTIDFLYCDNSSVSDSSFLSYYYLTDNPQSHPYGIDLVTLLNRTNFKTYIFTGSSDELVPLTHNRVKQVKHNNVTSFLIEDSGHFFRDLYIDDVMEVVLDIIKED